MCVCYLIIKFVSSKLQCCSLYKINTSYFSTFFKCNLHSIFYGGGSGRAPREVLRTSALLMSVQLQSRTPSVDPDVENYFCNAVHLASEISEPPRDASTVARWRPIVI